MMRGRREEQRLLKWKQDQDATRQDETKRRAEEAAQARPAPAWPPQPKHPHVAACVVCGSKDLVETRDSAIMFTVKDRPDAHYVDYPVLINILVCRDCGRLELFANDPTEFLSAYQYGQQIARPRHSTSTALPGEATAAFPAAVAAPAPGAPAAPAVRDEDLDPTMAMPPVEATATETPPTARRSPAPKKAPVRKTARKAPDADRAEHEDAGPEDAVPAEQQAKTSRRRRIEKIERRT